MAVNWSNYENWKNENKNKSTTKSKQSVDWSKYEAQKKINFDTFESDLANLNPTVESIANGWQNEETLTSSYPSIKAMYDRLNAYQNYRGANTNLPDLSEHTNYYKDVLDNWDNIVGTYGQFKTADDYNKALEREKSLPTADLDSIMGEITDLDTQIKDIKSKQMEYGQSAYSGKAEGTYKDWNKTIFDYDAQLKDLESKKAERQAYYNDAQAYKRDVEEEERAKTPEAKTGLTDFEADIKMWEEEINRPLSWGEAWYGANDVQAKGGLVYAKELYSENLKPKDDWSEEEKLIFGSYYYEDKEKGTTKAKDYATRVNKSHGEKEANEKKQKIANKSTSSFWSGAMQTGISFLEMPTSILDYYSKLTDVAAGQPIVQDEFISPFEHAQTVRGAVGESLNDWSGTLPDSIPVIGGKGVGDVYQLGTSIGDSMLSAFTLGSAGTLVSYFGQGAASGVDDALSRGATDEQALLYGTILGAAEGVSESIGAEKLVGLNSADTVRNLLSYSAKNGFGKKAISLLNKQGLAESFEEGFSSLAGQITDRLVLKDKSEFNLTVNKLMAEGLSKDEATKKAWLQSFNEIAFDVLGGYISGAAHGGMSLPVSMYKTNIENEKLGGTIREGGKVGDVLDTLAMTPKESETYKAYQRYFGSGITADNVTDAQLGNMYAIADEEARDVLSSRKSTLEQRKNATETLKKLSAIHEEGTVSKDDIKAIDRRNTYEEGLHESAELLISEGLESAENTKSFKLAKEFKERVANGEKLSTQDILKLQKANTDAIREEEANAYAESLPETEKNLFLKLYDGKTDVDSFSNSFAFVSEYAKNDFSHDYILEHKGVLTAKQAGEIYRTYITDRNARLEEKIKSLKEEYKNSPFVAGNFNDSIISYDNTNAEGKVRWNSLRTDQKKGIILLSTLGLKAGMDIELVTNGEEKGFDGFFKISKNKIYIDVHAGLTTIDGKKIGKALIIPTISHEMTHWMEKKVPELYRKYSEYVMDTLKMSGKTEDQILAERRRHLERNRPDENFTDADVRKEVIARASEDMFAKSEEIQKMLSSLTDKEKNQFVQKVKELLLDMKNWLNDFLSSQKSNSDEAKVIRQFQNRIDKQIELWDKMLKASIETNQALKKAGKTTVDEESVNNNKIQFADNQDPRTLTEEQLRHMLENAQFGEYGDNTYIPVRISTPPILIAEVTAHSQGKIVPENLPMIMPVWKVRQAMEEDSGESYGKNRPHEMDADDIISIMVGLTDPAYIVYQEENGRYVEIVKYFSSRKKRDVLVSIDFGELGKGEFKYSNYLNGYEQGYYNIIVTTYSPDDLADYLNKENHYIVRDKEKGASQVGSSSILPSHLKDTPFYEPIVPQNGNDVKSSEENSGKQFADRDSDAVNQSMTMEEAKQMIERAFVLGNIKNWYDGEYKNGDEWLKAQGVEEVALYIENEYSLQQKYLDKIQGILNDEFYVTDILESYLKGTLTGKAKPKPKRLDTSKEYRINDERFYSPQRIKDVKKLLNVANQRVTKQNRSEVLNARARILLFAHNKGASELLGLTQAELNKKLRTWGGYPAGARELSAKINNGVADSNKWTGIENCSWLYRHTVTTKELESLVKSITGIASDYEKFYIARTMLALDTHIDWSWLSFDFDTQKGVVKKHGGDSKTVLGFYSDDQRKIVVSTVDGFNTVAHEMGHALDYQWARDLGFSRESLTDVYRNTERITDAETRQFFDNFKNFIDSLTDNSNISSAYTQESKEVFARFVAKFVQWVDNTGTGNKQYDTEFSYYRAYYRDRFTSSHYIEFIKLLQEKSMLDAKKMVENVQYSDRDSLGTKLSKGQMEYFKDSKVRDEEGNLLVLWHGTYADFTVFDIEKAGINWEGNSRYGKGFYFAKTRHEALGWTEGTNVIKAYLNLVNPLNVTKKATPDIAEEIDKYIKEKISEYSEEEFFITKEQYLENLKRHKEMYLNDVSLFLDELKYDNNGKMTDAIREFLSNLGYDGIIAEDEIVAFYPEQIKSTDNLNPTEDKDILYADREISDLDAEYLELAKNPEKNEARLREMVDAEAKRNGYNSPILYHGTYAFGFTRIDTKKSNDHISFFTTDSLQTAGTYSGTGNVRNINESKESSLGIYQFYANVNGMLELEANGEESNHIGLGLEARDFNYYLQPKSWHTHATAKQVSRYAKQKGYQGVIIQNVIDVANPDARKMANASNVYVFFNPQEQLKSADLVTYDDKGNIIPLSKRFNTEETDIRYSERVTDLKTLDFLNKQIENGEYIKVYRSFQVINGGLYAPMNAVDRDENGKNKKLGYRSEYGVWEKATESPEVAQRYMESHPGSNYAKFDLDGVDNKTNAVAYNPYLHASNLVLNDQFSAAYRRNLITVECYVPLSEANGTYKAKYSKDATGWTEWKAGKVAGKLVKMKPEYTRKLFLSRYMLPVRQVPDSEVAAMYKEYLDGTNISIPWNVVTPSLRKELEKIGVSVSYDDIKTGTKTIKFTDVFSKEETQFSDRDKPSIYELLGEVETLRKENKSFREDVARLKERLKLEKEVTGGKVLNENQLGIVAGQIRQIANSTFDKKELVNRLRDYYGYIMSGEEFSWDDIFDEAYSIAEEVLKDSKQPKHTNKYYQTIMHDIRNSRISFSEEQKQEFEYLHGANWHKAFFGKLNVANDGVPLDTKWQEWSHRYPDIFKEDVNALDQANELYEIYDALKEGMEVYEEYDSEEMARWLAYEIYDRFWRVNNVTTTADKYDKQIKRLNYEHRNAMTEMRDNHNKQLEEQKLADEMHYGKLIEKIKRRNEESLAEAKRLGKERLDSYKENAERKTKIQAITSKALTLNKWLVKNSKDEHIHDALKGPVINLLNAIDFSSKRLLGGGMPTQKDISLEKALRQVKDMMVKANNGAENLIALYGNDMNDELENLIKYVEETTNNFGDNEFILNQMSLAELQTLDKLIGVIKSAVTKLNTFHTVHHKKGIVNLAQEEIAYADSLGKEKQNKYTGAIKKAWKWTNALPYYAFKRFGVAGQKIFEAFQDGQDKLAFNLKVILDYTKSVYNSKDVKEWSKEIKEFNVPIPSENPNDIEFQKVRMTTSQIMSLYALWKRKAAQEHIVRGGLRIAKIEGKRGEIIDQVEGLVLEANEVEKIINTLTDKQKAVADKLQEFMNTVASKWGNEISMARFGIEMFNEEFYFPIQVDNNVLPPDGNDEQVASKPSPNNDLFKLLNMSFTKSLTENANNRIVVNDIFDVFAQHTSDMAKYNALALPVLDAFRWFNYKEKEDINGKNYLTSSVQASIEKAFGKDGKNYITQFLKDINGTVSQSRDTLAVKAFKGSKIASVGFNLRVVLLQPTSFFRASAVIENKYLAKAFAYIPNIAKLKRAMDRSKQYCGMALWKSLGYFDTNVSRGMAEQIKHAEGWRDKAIEFSMKAAGKADEITLGVLWNAAELELRDTRKDLKVGSEEFYQAVGLRLREIIYATQVVDSTMTRSEWMRSPDTHDKILTMFASEPTLAQNMVADAFIQTNLDARELGSKKEAFKKNKKKIAKVITAYVVTNAVAALVESGFDWYRDDDEEEMDLEEFMKLYLSNFGMDMSLLGKIPYLKDILSIMQGYSSSRSELQWMESVYQVYKGVSKHLQGEGNPVTTVKNGIKTISFISGLGFYNIYRDIMSGLYKIDVLDAEDFEEMLKDWWNID